MTATVDIVCAVLNGEPFLADFFRGLDDQTYDAWRLWVRDDGSTDRTVEMIRERAATDPRVHLIHVGGPKSGATRAYAWLLDHLPSDARYVMFGDADDVWLPNKIARSMDAMLEAEAPSPKTPLLVHTDMIVVDAALNKIHDSFWAYSSFYPEPATVRRVIVRNVAAGQTILMNRALCDRIGSMPDEAIYNDGWVAIVAAATGRIIAIPDKTVLYRQHGANSVGAAQSKANRTLVDVGRAVWRGLQQGEIYRTNLARTARQARAALERYGADMSGDDRAFVEAYSRIPERSVLRRKLDLIRFNYIPEIGLLRNIGGVLRG